MWFLSSLWFLPSLWFLDELVVFGRDCGFLSSLWFLDELVVFVELVDLRSKVVINGKPKWDLTTESRLC